MSVNVLESIIVGGDAEKLVKTADSLGRRLAKDLRYPLSSSQIRTFFGTVKRLSMKWTKSASSEEARRAYSQLVLLKPKLAYQQGRQGRGEKAEALRLLRNTLDPAIELVDGDWERFQNFVNFFEAILAYHRAHGGR